MEQHPSGRQHVLVAGDLVAVVVEVGGGLRALTHAARPLVDGYGVHEQASGARGAVLAPWPNRLGDGRYSFDGQDRQLPLSEPSTSTAIHGLARYLPWRTVRQDVDAVELAADVVPQKGWPVGLALRATYVLRPDGLEVELCARNVGDADLPVGLGQHPYLAAPPGGLVDGCTLTAPAATRLRLDERGLPAGREPVAGTEHDLTDGLLLGDRRLDDATTDLARGADGRAEVVLAWPGGGGARWWADERAPWVQLFTGDTLAADRRRQGLAVEPMTCPPDALATGQDVVRLAPGQETGLGWGVGPLR